MNKTVAFQMERRITINDVAKAAQVSNGTVHRALNGKPGVSDAVRQNIIRIAHEIGYEPNIVASSLKKKPYRIIVAFPGLTKENRYFYGELWNGYRELKKEMMAYNLDIIETPYYDDEINGFASNMKLLMRQYHGEIDGVIGGGKFQERDICVAEQMVSNEIPLVLVGDGMDEVDCFYSVQSEHSLDGRMAAELLTSQLPEGSSILLCAGDVLLPSNCANTAGFEAFIQESGKDYKVIKFYGIDDLGAMEYRIEDVLLHDGNVRGLYSVSARGSLPLAQAIERCGKKGEVRMVGSDLYPESIDYMRKGIIQFIIDKNPRHQAATGFRCLVDYLIRKKMPQKKDDYIISTIVCKSNLEKYIQTHYKQ